MNLKELRVVAILAGIFSLRMLGVAMLLPIFAVAALQYSAANAQLIGLAVGVYGLAQAVLQIPFGMLSDKYGRKPVILAGLLLIALGSLIAARTSSIYGLICGRVLQGCGAIGSVVIALMADHVREIARTSAMAILGASIGLSFALALVLGPWLYTWVGLPGIFTLVGVGAVLGGGLLFTLPEAASLASKIGRRPGSFGAVLALTTNIALLYLNFGVFVLHATLAAVFLVMPLIIQQTGLAAAKLWYLYLLVLLPAMLFAWRLIQAGERRQKIRQMQGLAILGLLIALVLLYIFNSLLGIAGGLIIFFTAFCVLEASLPTLVSKYATETQRGTALGMYSCLQFLGIFVGGVVGGWLHSHFNAFMVLGFCIALVTSWLIFSIVFDFRNRRVQLWQEA